MLLMESLIRESPPAAAPRPAEAHDAGRRDGLSGGDTRELEAVWQAPRHRAVVGQPPPGGDAGGCGNRMWWGAGSPSPAAPRSRKRLRKTGLPAQRGGQSKGRRAGSLVRVQADDLAALGSQGGPPLDRVDALRD